MLSKTCQTKRSVVWQKGQTLVVVLVVLVIAAIVTTAVSYRAIKNIRLSAEKRDSALAASQIDSLLDVAMSEDFWDNLWVVDGPFYDFSSDERVAHDIPPVYWVDYLDTNALKCKDDGWNVSARRSSESVSSFFIGKDEVMEVDLREANGVEQPSSTVFNIGWNGEASYLILKFYDENGITHSIALTHDDPNLWDLGDSVNTEIIEPSTLYSVTLEDAGFPDTVRIRAVGGDGLLDISGLASGYFQFGELKAYCYIGDVYREYISQFMLRGSTPAVFDYALFDGTGSISGANVE